jgi:carbonic anhydrase
LSTLLGMSTLPDLVDSNNAWERDVEQPTPGFSDGPLSGELFVQRDVANVVAHSDLNCLSVMAFAIDSLKVKHTLVVGHCGCSGVHAAMSGVRIGLAENSLCHVQDVRNQHRPWLQSLPDVPLRRNALCEPDVLMQFSHVRETTVVYDAWSRGQEVVVHGWVRGLNNGLNNGLIKGLHMSVASSSQVQPTFEQALADIQ